MNALADEARRIGWCIGVVGGADLLQGRMEPSGLRWMVATILDEARIELEPGAPELPDLAGSPQVAREVSLAAAWCLLQARRVGVAALRWESNMDRGCRSLVLHAETRRVAFARRCSRAKAAHPRILCKAGERVVLEWSEEGG